jgi:hypothetical protein
MELSFSPTTRMHRDDASISTRFRPRCEIGVPASDHSGSAANAAREALEHRNEARGVAQRAGQSAFVGGVDKLRRKLGTMRTAGTTHGSSGDRS